MRHVNWIRSERESRGLSQANLARLLDTSQPRLSQWETGKATPSNNYVSHIKSVLADFDVKLKSGTLPDAIRPRSYRRILQNRNDHEHDERTDQCSDESRQERLKRFGKFAKTYKPNRKPVSLALFSGCGGMSLGFKQAGFNVPGYVELDPGARAIYERNFPDAVCLGHDVTAITQAELTKWRKAFGHLTVLFGGPPCQGFSLTGKRDRFDSRSTLYSHFARIAGVLKPEYVVLENVRLLTSMTAPDGSLVLDKVYKAFAEVGYSCHHKILNAQDYGVPQFRARLIVIGTHSGNRPTFPTSTHGSVERHVTFRDACGGLESLESGERSSDDPWHFAVKHPERVIRWLQNVPEGESAHNNSDPNLRPPCGYNTTYKRIKWDEPCSTISTTFGMISGSRNVHPTNTRSLTIREATRCQTFPDDFIFCGNLGTIRTVIGNAVPPRLAKAVASHLLNVEI